MPIHFTCPHCGMSTEVADQYAGQSGPCIGCGQTITIPPLRGAAGDAPPTRRSQGPMIALIVVATVLGVAVVCGGILAALLLPAVGAAREAGRRAQCANNLKQIALAMLNYHDANGHFPPAYVADKNGKPMHSWRVLLLPYLQRQDLYDQYHLDEPWDSPNNRLLANQMPDVYRCPSDTQSGPSQTSYVIIAGRQTAFDGSTAVSMKDLKRGAGQTLLVIEATGSNITWLEPRDVDVSQLGGRINGPAGSGVRSGHPHGINAALCDGSVRFFDNSTSPQELRQMTQIDSAGP